MWDFREKDAGRKGFVAHIEVGCCNGILWVEKEREAWVQRGSRDSWSVRRLWAPRPLAFHGAGRRLINPGEAREKPDHASHVIHMLYIQSHVTLSVKST